MQIFVYRTGINNNFPMIKINNNEIINLINKLDYYNTNRNEYKNEYFVVNNS